MSTYQKDDGTLESMANRLIEKFEPLNFIKAAEIKIDFIWAYGARNDDGELVGDAIKKNGIKAFGLCRIIPLKDRAKGNGDCEIMIDRDWWDSVDEPEREAVLDHELSHVKLGKDVDDLGRPKLKLRKHNFEFGWFTDVAQRHGSASMERKQAAVILEMSGQYYWPSLVKAVDTAKAEQPTQRFQNIASEIGKEKK